MFSFATQYNTYTNGLDEYVSRLQRWLYNMKYYSPYFWIGQCTQNCTDIEEKIYYSFLFIYFLYCLSFFFVFVIFLQNLLDYAV